MKWFMAFSICSLIEMYLEKTGLSRRKSNIISCILFQSFFVITSLQLLFLEAYNYNKFDIKKLTLQNIHNIYGYFIYDTLYVLIYNPKPLFIFHHLLCFIIIQIINNFMINNNISSFYIYNAICLIAEIQNPILNARTLTCDYPSLKKLNIKILYWSYFIFRIIIFPIISIIFLCFHRNISYFYILVVMFIALYIASFIWFKQITRLAIT